MLSVATAQLIGLFFESILYGIYLVTFGICLTPRTYPHPGRLRLPVWKLPWPIALVTLVICVMGTVNLALTLVLILDSQFCRAIVLGSGVVTRAWTALAIVGI
jgi:hypothetical protein